MKQIINFFFVLLIVLFTISACKDSKTSKTNSANHEINENQFKAGSFINEIYCRNNRRYSYAAYIPISYLPDKKMPLFVVFDAHARTKLALQKFKTAADQFGFIIIASKQAQNGYQAINDLINNLFEDAFSRFKIDKRRVYTAGFSGGARIASSVAIYKGGIRGVIACAGGLPSVGQEIQRKFDFAGIVGLEDFNYLEMVRLDEILEKNKFNHYLFTFKGGHEWPQESVIFQAVQWLNFMAMKSGIIPTDDNLIRAYSSQMADSINNYIMHGENYHAFKLYKIFLSTLSGMYDVTEYQKSFEFLVKQQSTKNQLNKHEKLLKQEAENQTEFINLFKEGKFAQIRTKTRQLHKKSLSKDLFIRNKAKRNLNYMSMLSYLFCNNEIKQGNKVLLKKYLDIYQNVDKENPDRYYFEAILAAQNNNPEKALTYLQKAASLGYYDYNKILNEFAFESLKSQPSFIKITDRILKNKSKL